MRYYFNQMLVPLFVFLFTLYVGYHAFCGESSILFLIKNQREMYEIKKNFATMRKKDIILMQKIHWLREKSLNLRFIDGILYDELGFTKPGMQVVRPGE